MPATPRWSHQRDGPLFYAHIPRTAGSQLSNLLMAMLPAGLSFGEQSAALECWPQSPAPPLVVFGHTMPPDLGFKCEPKPRYAVATMVREPLAHLISRSKLADHVCDWLRVHRPTDDLGQPTVFPPRCGCEHFDDDTNTGEDTSAAGCGHRAARRPHERWLRQRRFSKRQQCEARRNKTSTHVARANVQARAQATVGARRRSRMSGTLGLHGVVDEGSLAEAIIARANSRWGGYGWSNQLDWVGSGYPGAPTGQTGCLGLREGCASPTPRGTCNSFNSHRPAATSERLCPIAERLRRANASLDAMAWVGLTERLAPSLCLLRKTLLDGVSAETRARFVPPAAGVRGGGGSVTGWWQCGCMKTCRGPSVVPPPPPPPPPPSPPCLLDPTMARGSGGRGGGHRGVRGWLNGWRLRIPHKGARGKAPRVRGGECERPDSLGSYHSACCDGGARLDSSIQRSASNGLSRLLRERFGASVWPPLAAHLASEMAMYAHATRLHAQRVEEAGC